MNLLMLGLIAKAAQEQNRGYRRRSSRKREQSPKSSSSHSSTTYSEMEYLYGVIAEDPALREVFQAIAKKGEEIDDMDAEAIRKEVEAGLKAQAEKGKKIEEKIKELAELGVVLEVDKRPYNYDTVAMGVKVLDSEERSAFENKGEYAYKDKLYPKVFEGLLLKKDLFTPENRDHNPFESSYMSWKERNPDIDEQIRKAEKEVEKWERKLQSNWGDDYKKEQKLKIARGNLYSLKDRKEQGETYRVQYEAFAKLTPEQKDKIVEYLELLEDAQKSGKDVEANVKKYNAIYERAYYYSDTEKSIEERRKWPRAVEGLIEDGVLSEDLLDAVDSILSQEELGYEKYSEGLGYYSSANSGLHKKFRQVVDWYYGERKERILTKALQRKEAAYKALIDENKRLCEAAGLVDKAEELEGQDPNNVKKGDEKNGE